jgi:hypothetical protein
MSGSGDPSEKKDLTSIIDLPQADPIKREGQNQEEFNQLQPIDQIQDFESLDQIGMMDHPTPPEEPQSDAGADLPAFQSEPETQDSPSLDFNPGTDPLPDVFGANEPEVGAQATPESKELSPSIEGGFSMDAFHSEAPSEPLSIFDTNPAPSRPILEDLKSYSDSKKAAPFEPGVRNHFNLILSGEFDPYSRDKLLLFITENPIGLSSSELDFQISAKRVLLPRISEFSGIKMIQELRDTGLSFRLKRSEEDSDAYAEDQDQNRFHYQAAPETSPDQDIPVLSLEMIKIEEYTVLDSIQLVQYLRAEILEIEKSDLFQDLLQRMTDALKRRAKLKGASALTRLEHRITPLRLPSQYQIELSASLLRRRSP